MYGGGPQYDGIFFEETTRPLFEKPPPDWGPRNHHYFWAELFWLVLFLCLSFCFLIYFFVFLCEAVLVSSALRACGWSFLSELHFELLVLFFSYVCLILWFVFSLKLENSALCYLFQLILRSLRSLRISWKR